MANFIEGEFGCGVWIKHGGLIDLAAILSAMRLEGEHLLVTPRSIGRWEFFQRAVTSPSSSTGFPLCSMA